ncbi:MAG: hypothetical protein AB1486_07940 [Planctomycetota bacterium]
MSRFAALFTGLVVLLTAVLGVLLAAEVPTVQRLEGWFWPFRSRDILDMGLLAAIALFLPAVVAFIAGRPCGDRSRAIGGLVLLLLLGLALPQAFVLLEKTKLEPSRQHLYWEAENTYYHTVSGPVTAHEILTGYDELIATIKGRYALFLGTKPPGRLLLYYGLAELAERVVPDRPPGEPLEYGLVNERHRKLVELLMVILPLLPVLTLLPLAWLGRCLLAERALWPVLLFVLTPSWLLLTLSADHFLHPLLSALLWVLSAKAGLSSRWAWLWGLFLGLVSWLALYVSFAFLPAILLAPVVAWAAARQHRREEPPGVSLRRLGIAFGTAGALFLALGLMAWWVLDYDMSHRFVAAMETHRRVMKWEQTRGMTSVANAAVLNLAEYAYYLALPLAGLFLWGIASSLRALASRRAAAIDFLTLAVAIVLLASSVLGSSKGEVARLWLFLLPLVVVASAQGFTRMVPSPSLLLWQGFAVLQVTWAFLLKWKQVT